MTNCLSIAYYDNESRYFRPLEDTFRISEIAFCFTDRTLLTVRKTTKWVKSVNRHWLLYHWLFQIMEKIDLLNKKINMPSAEYSQACYRLHLQ